MSAQLVNGELIDAQVAAIMSGNRADIDRYLIRSAMVTQAALVKLPDQMTEAVATHSRNCPLVELVNDLETESKQAQGKRTFLAVVPTWVGMVAFIGSLVVAIIALIHS